MTKSKSETDQTAEISFKPSKSGTATIQVGVLNCEDHL